MIRACACLLLMTHLINNKPSLHKLQWTTRILRVSVRNSFKLNRPKSCELIPDWSKEKIIESEHSFDDSPNNSLTRSKDLSLSRSSHVLTNNNIPKNKHHATPKISKEAFYAQLQMEKLRNRQLTHRYAQFREQCNYDVRVQIKDYPIEAMASERTSTLSDKPVQLSPTKRRMLSFEGGVLREEPKSNIPNSGSGSKVSRHWTGRDDVQNPAPVCRQRFWGETSVKSRKTERELNASSGGVSHAHCPAVHTSVRRFNISGSERRS